MPLVHNRLKGVVLMLAGTAFLAWNDAVAKHLSTGLPVGQIVCLRQIAAIVFILGIGTATLGPGAFRIVNAPLQVLRGLAFVASTLLIVTALSLLPLPVVSAIAFSSPIAVAVLSMPVLGERVSPTRWLAILAGFIGVLIVIRPGGASFEWALLLAAAAAIATAFRDVLTRRLARTDSSLSILLWSSVLVVAASAATALWWPWRPVETTTGLWLVVNGFLNASTHFLIISAYRHGEAAMLSPLRYTGLMWAAVIGWLVWQDFPDAATVVGAVIIAVASTYAAEDRRPPAKPA